MREHLYESDFGRVTVRTTDDQYFPHTDEQIAAFERWRASEGRLKEAVQLVWTAGGEPPWTFDGVYLLPAKDE